MKKGFLHDVAAIQVETLRKNSNSLKRGTRHHNIDRLQQEMAAKSGKIAPFVFVNSGKFQQN